MKTDIETLTLALTAAAKAFLEAVGEGHTEAATVVTTGGPIEYDPLVDAPPYSADPSGTHIEQKMSSLSYLGAVARLNAEKNRGASSAEVTRFAKAAGYPDGRAVNGWNSRANSPRVIDNVDGARYLNESGHAYIAELADELKIALMGDVTPLPIPAAEQQ